MINKIKIIINTSLIFLLSGCNGGLINGNHNLLPVRSEPSGASVYVMGEQQGVTPMTLNITKLYPVAYSKENEQDYGRITLKHEGCSDLTVKVTNDMTGKGLKEKLACVGDDKNIEKEAILSDKSIRQRLQELKMLKDDGLIDGEEYQKIRRRILQSL